MYASYATGPYVSPCGFARSQRPFVWIRVADLARARRPDRTPSVVVLDREVPPRRLAVDDPLGADHAGVADVDHVRALDVEPDAEAGEEDRRARAAPRPASAARPACRGSVTPIHVPRSTTQTSSG